MTLKKLYELDIKTSINGEEWTLRIEPAQHPREHAALFSLVDPTGEPKNFTLMDKEPFKVRDKDTVIKEIIEPTLNRLKARRH